MGSAGGRHLVLLRDVGRLHREIKGPGRAGEQDEGTQGREQGTRSGRKARKGTGTGLRDVPGYKSRESSGRK